MADDKVLDFWVKQNEALKKHEDFPVFKTWAEVRGIPLYNPFESLFEGYSKDNEAMLLRSPDEEEWTKILAPGESKRGHTDASHAEAMRYSFRGNPTSVWVMKTLNHVLTFEELMEKSILDYGRIVEFGAGIGETAKMIFDRGFTGQYEIVDLEGIGRISDYYLEGKAKQITNIDDLEPASLKKKPKTLFIATWSLSETPFEYRKKIAEKIQGMDQLIIFQNNIFGMTNQQFFFDEWPHLTNTFQRLRPMGFHPGDGGNIYLISKAV